MSSSHASLTHRSTTARKSAVWRSGMWCAMIPITAVIVDQLMRHTALPTWARISLSLLPLIPGAFFLRTLRQHFANADELALHITREALVFVFFALLSVFIVIDLLENGGVLTGFSWDTKKLAGTMAALAFIGTWLAARRYR